jgi:hypothetical protein
MMLMEVLTLSVDAEVKNGLECLLSNSVDTPTEMKVLGSDLSLNFWCGDYLKLKVRFVSPEASGRGIFNCLMAHSEFTSNLILLTFK